MVESGGQLDGQQPAGDGSGGGFKETAAMLRRHLEEKGFSTMRSGV